MNILSVLVVSFNIVFAAGNFFVGNYAGAIVNVTVVAICLIIKLW